MNNVLQTEPIFNLIDPDTVRKLLHASRNGARLEIDDEAFRADIERPFETLRDFGYLRLERAGDRHHISRAFLTEAGREFLDKLEAAAPSEPDHSEEPTE